ncbi:methyltransferase domain-containing protein [Opitutaceae bacterium TAV4]|nr:methyltransferase domain-containing protein [Opitutaceae bacterium TAV4]RRJ99542.1 methyltransferase domain-containing protein [Opitutaceae bacterium TAV3]
MSLEQVNSIRAQRIAGVRERLAPLLAGGGGGAAAYERVTLEIGCGHGHFLAAYAAAHPHELCIGIDLLRDRLERAGRKSERAGLSNIAWIQAEAALFMEALEALAADGIHVRLTRIWLLFSDPWPKRRHWKHRVAQPVLMSALAARSVAGTEFCFRTDYEPYFRYASQVVMNHPCWALPGGNSTPELPHSWPFEEETVFQSRAERFYSFVALRTSALVPVEPPPMPDMTEPSTVEPLVPLAGAVR